VDKTKVGSSTHSPHPPDHDENAQETEPCWTSAKLLRENVRDVREASSLSKAITVGPVIGPCRLGRLLGSGGMGLPFVGEHTVFGPNVHLPARAHLAGHSL
jgi:hypothetical protein